MPQIKSKLLALSLKKNELTKRETERVVNAIKFGIKAWVRKAESIIPIYSGASHASLDQLASVVGLNVSTIPTRAARERLGPAKIAQRQSQARSESEGGIKVTPNRITFFYKSTLQWLVDNELGERNDAVSQSGNLITPIPYNFIDRANDAANAVIVNRLKGRTIDLRGLFDIKQIR